jgi:hypothetical protein
MNVTNNKIVAGSLGAVSKKQGQSLAKGFLDVKAFVMVDISASMFMKDAPGGQSRYNAACQQLERLQNEMPGEVGVASFSDVANFCPSGVPIGTNSGTDMIAALNMMKMADGCGIRLVLISDGEPNDQAGTLKLAAKFTSKIDTIFVGNEMAGGAEFLRKLSAATGGIAVVNKTEKLDLLGENLTKLISAGGAA